MHRHTEVIILIYTHPTDDGGLPVMEVELVVDEAVRRPVRGVAQQGAPLSHMATLRASRTGL